MRCSIGDLGRLPLPFRLSVFRLSALAFMLALASASPASADTLQGRVLDPAGRPVALARVLLLRGQTVVSSTTTTADGRYGPIQLPPGDYDIVVAASGLRLAPTSIVVGDAPLTQDLHTTLAALQESVLVSAALTDAARSRSASSASTLTRTDLDAAQITTVIDAVRLVPGFGVATAGTTGSQTSLFPRGGESDYTLVLVDGVPQNVFGGGFDAAHTATANVDRIEVVRGPQSALYGSGAIGGIVHLITANGGDPRVSATFEGGGYGTRASTASAASSHGAWSFGGGFDWLDSDGETGTFDSIGGPVSNDDYSRASGSGSLTWSDQPSRRIRLDVRGGRYERGYPGAYGSDPEGLFGGLDTISRGTNHHASVGLSAVLRSGQSLDHRIQMTWSDANGEFISPFDEPGKPSKDSNGRLTGRYQLDLLAGATGVSVGAEALRESATSTFIVDEASSMLPVRRNDIGLFAEARPAFGDRLFTTIGLRVERLDRSALAAGSFRPAFEPSIVWSANPKGSVAWIARPASSAGSALGSTTLRASAGTGIKPPTAFDIAFTDNPDLKPERSRSVDVGVEQSLFASRAIVDATWFYNSYDDLIVSISQPLSGASRYQTDNIANAKSSGLELGAAWRLSPAVTARASWTWLDTEVLGVDSLPGIGFSVYAVGDALVRRPRHAGTLDVNWRTDRASAFAIVSVRGAMRDLEPNWASSVYTNPRRVTTTIGAALRLAPALELYGRVLNAFDSDYEDVLGFPAPGRSAMIGLRVTAGH